MDHMKELHPTERKKEQKSEISQSKMLESLIDKSKKKSTTTTDYTKPVRRNSIRLPPETQFECFICKQEFSSRHTITMHMKSHYRHKRCIICDRECTEAELETHICSQQFKEIACEYCPQIFASTAAIVTHLNEHESDKKYHRCVKCPRFFAMQRLKLMHEENHVDVTPTYSCQICNRRFTSEKRLQVHLKHLHASDKSLYFGDTMFTVFCCGTFLSFIEQFLLRFFSLSSSSKPL